MKKIVVASKNPVKLRAAESGFRRFFPGLEMSFEALSVPSGVADQPFTDAETLLGARQRAEEAECRRPDADFWIGLEGGIEDDPAEGGAGMTAFAWVVVRAQGRRGQSRTATLALPDEVAELVRSGVELGEANDRIYGRSNSKQAEGAVGLLTGGVIDRAELYEPSVVLALIPFRQPST